MSSFCSSLSRVPALLRRHETCLIRHRLYPSLPLCHGWHVRLGHLKFRCHHLNLRIGCAVGKPPGVRSQQIVIMKLALSLLAAPAIAFTAPQTSPTRAATQLFAYVPGVLRGAISLRRAAMVWREVAVCESTSYGIDATHTHTRRYVPSGMDPAAYAALKKKEAAASKKSDRKAYKSRSVQK